MSGWNITVVNKTGKSGSPGKAVRVMLYQTVPHPRLTESYCTAWRVRDVAYPGTFGPIFVPHNVQFYVVDKTSEGDRRETGPIEVKLGQEINVCQTNKSAPPKVHVSDMREHKEKIKATNESGNVQSLQMALYKNGNKLVSFKRVVPDYSIYLSIQSVIYIADAREMIEGEEFKAAIQVLNSTAFQLYPDKQNVEIQIRIKHSGELEFIEI